MNCTMMGTAKLIQRASKIIVWTKSMKRLYLVKRCYEVKEPVLLIGETGGRKTTVCQLLSEAIGRKLHILNCHQYTETSDFIGVAIIFWFAFVIMIIFYVH